MEIRSWFTKAMYIYRNEGLGSLCRKGAIRLFSAGEHAQGEVSGDGAIPPCDVLFINGCDSSVPHPTRYRVCHQMEQLALWGVSVADVYYEDLTLLHKDSASIFIFFRCPITDNVKSVIEAAHQEKKTVYFDVDDLTISTDYTDDLPVVKGMGSADKALFDDGVRRMGETLSMCDAAIVSTNRLAIELKKIVPKTFVNRNVASRAMVGFSEDALRGLPAKDPDRVVVGYFSGSMTHNEDFALVLDALSQVMEERPQVYLKVVGDLELPVQLGQYSERILFSPLVDWRELPRLIGSVDVNLAPLADTLFNEAKSENKWVEAALVKVPTIASAVGAFDCMIKSNKTGVLCASSDEWKEALLRMVDDVAWRSGIAQNAYDYCREHCVTEKTGYWLAAKLFGRGRSIEEIAPSEQAARNVWVDNYLASRNLPKNTKVVDAAPWEKLSFSERLQNAQDASRNGYKLALLIYEKECGDTATFRYFGYNIAQRLDSSCQWRASYFFNNELAGLSSLLGITSAIVIIRGRIRPDLYAFIEEAKQAGVPTAYAMDDNALGACMAPRIIQAMAQDPENAFEKEFWYGTSLRFELAASLTDCFFAASPYYANVLKQRYLKPSYIVRSSLNDEQVSMASDIVFSMEEMKNKRRQFIVGYFSGTASHQQDFGLAEAGVVRFLRTHEDARLLLVGCFELDDALFELYRLGRVIVLPRVEYVILQYLQASVDVVLAPLEQDEFTHCKSALKVFEAGVVGVPACASPAFCYQEAIRDKETGYICNSENDWFVSLERLYADPNLARQMGENARQFALKTYYGEVPLREVEDALSNLSVTSIHQIPDETAHILKVLSGEAVEWDDIFAVNAHFANLLCAAVPNSSN